MGCDDTHELRSSVMNMWWGQDNMKDDIFENMLDGHCEDTDNKELCAYSNEECCGTVMSGFCWYCICSREWPRLPPEEHGTMDLFGYQNRRIHDHAEDDYENWGNYAFPFEQQFHHFYEMPMCC